MTTRLNKLIATYARLEQLLHGIPDPAVVRVRETVARVEEFVAELQGMTPAPTKSQVAGGLEQGLREMPLVLARADAHWRLAASSAMQAAIASEYPEFLTLERARLDKVLARGRVRSEAEYHLVRHHVDVLEGAPEHQEQVEVLYRLLDEYEVRH